MNWATQALHIAQKDARNARVTLSLYALVSAAALYCALSFSTDQVGPPAVLVTAVLMLFGMILVAAAVQADSPTQSNAFWASRPFYPTAMLAGKCVFAAVVIAIPLAAELIGLLRFDASATLMASMVVQSTLYYAMLLIATIVLAALTPDIRGFVVAALMVMASIFLVLTLASQPFARSPLNMNGSAWSFDVHVAFVVVALVGAAALLAWLYRRRDVSQVAWVGGVVVVSMCLLSLGDVERTHAAESTAAANRDGIRLTAARLENSNASLGPQLWLQFDAPKAGQTRRIVVRVNKVAAKLHDGSTVLAFPTFPSASVASSSLTLPEGIQPIAVDNAWAPQSPAFVNFREEDRARIMRIGIEDVNVEVTAIVREAEPVLTTVVGKPATKTIDGYRVRLDMPAATATEAPVVNVTITALGARNDGDAGPTASVAVVNESLREGFTLWSRQSSGSLTSMVLVGAQVQTSRLRFETNVKNRRGVRLTAIATPLIGAYTEAQTSTPMLDTILSPQWYAGAKVTVLRWTDRSSYQVGLSKSMP
ncbi:MAG TPA: hypothetical protein VGM82_20920 [Gemmatimonadaceae bacterium]|jgi:hypothetical protein